MAWGGCDERTESGTEGAGPPWLLLAVWTYGALAVFVWVGFASHRGSEAVVGPYTPQFAAFLLGLGLLLLVPVALLVLLRSSIGDRRGVKALLSVGAVVVVAGALAELVYATTRTHGFDPFLQRPGARFEHLPRMAPDEVTRVITLGGSTTLNAHLPVDRRYPTLLEEELSALASYEVLNAGMDWWTSKHTHVNYVTYLRDWNPDVVVVMHAINDLYRSFSPPEYAVGPYDSQWAHFYGPAIRGARPLPWVGGYFNSWNVQEITRRWYTRGRFKEVDLDVDAYLSLPEFEKHLRSLVRTLRQDGVQVLILTQPSLYREDLTRAERARLWFPSTFCATRTRLFMREVPSPQSMARAMEAYNSVVLRIGREEGVEVLDLADRIPKTLEFFADDVHYTDAGAALVASAVAKALLASRASSTTTERGGPPPTS